MDELAKLVAQLALRLNALPASALRDNPRALDATEYLARRVLHEVASLRSTRSPGESSGIWPAVQPNRPQ